MHLLTIDMDGSIAAQESLPDVAAWTTVDQLDLRDLGPRLRLWSRAGTIREARDRIAALPNDEPALHLLGSGDFHHLAVLLIERAREPVTVIHIDNHPDWVRLAPRWHCGSWVNQALRLAQVKRVVTLGVCSDDLVRPDLKGGNLAALSAGRIVMLPWNRAPSRVWHRVVEGFGHHYSDGYLHWRNLAQDGIAKNLAGIVGQIQTDAIWLSIDKDVLPQADAITNWDQGQMPLDAVLELIAQVGARKRIIGADICGEYSPPRHRNWFKRFEARHDQPQFDLPDAVPLERNERTNRRLLATIEQATRAC
ncbi:MAG: hypothetical protein WBV39_11340 [Rudaea sp.]